MSATSTSASEVPASPEAMDEQALRVHRCPSGAMARTAVAVLEEQRRAGLPLSEMAVLARVNSALLPVQVALTESRVPHSAPLDASVLGRTGLRTALAYLRMGLDLERIRRDDLYDTINRPARKVKSAVAPLLGNRQRFSTEQLENVADALDDTHRDRFRGYLLDLRHLEQAITDGADTAKCLWIIRNRIGLDEAMDALDSSSTRPEGSSHGDDLDALDQLAELQPDPAAFREWLTDRLRVPGAGENEAVTLATVHRVKGMEWDQVVVFAANRGLFPHRLSEDVEEERRVFHVAITRCRERVDVIADKARPSPFLDELSKPAPVRAERPATAAQATQPSGPVQARRAPNGAVFADPGLDVVLPGRIAGRITEAGRDHVLVRVAADLTDEDELVLRVPFGQPVTVDGESAPLTTPRPRHHTTPSRSDTPPTGAPTRRGGPLEEDEGPVDPALFEALRSWRARIAAETGVPAYLVFHDRHLRTIAARTPASLRELGQCPGVGPTKLERYGDDVLDVIASHIS